MNRRRLSKRLLHSRMSHFFLSFIMSLVMRLIYATNRVGREFDAAALPYITGEKPAIFCFWHGRMIMHAFLKPHGRSMSVLISHHNDGALITATMRWFGIGSVRGSKKLGGPQAVRDLLSITDSGGNIAITPDGPRGPFQKAASGAAFVAAKTGYPLIPVTFSATRHARFRSWDKFMLPKPFGQIRFIVGAPQPVSQDDDVALTSANSALETALVALTREADIACGVAP